MRGTKKLLCCGGGGGDFKGNGGGDGSCGNGNGGGGDSNDDDNDDDDDNNYDGAGGGGRNDNGGGDTATVAGTYSNQLKAEEETSASMAKATAMTKTDVNNGKGNSDSCVDDGNDGGGPLCHSRRWLVVALFSATHYCCRSSHAVMQSPTLLSPVAFTAFAAPFVGWYLH